MHWSQDLGIIIASLIGYVMGTVSEHRAHRMPHRWVCPRKDCDMKVGADSVTVLAVVRKVHEDFHTADDAKKRFLKEQG